MRYKALGSAIVAIVAIVSGAMYYAANSRVAGNIIKTSVRENELSGKGYILCKRARTTGFDWLLIKNEQGKRVRELVNIRGAHPFRELHLSVEFRMADNTFVFYVEERNTQYSAELGQDNVEYVVSGWDVLYPVKHSDIDLLPFSRTNMYITDYDIGQVE